MFDIHSSLRKRNPNERTANIVTITPSAAWRITRRKSQGISIREPARFGCRARIIWPITCIR